MNYHTHECVITGDENDGDRVNSVFTLIPGKEQPFISENQFWGGQRAVGKIEFLNALSLALLFPRDGTHNWSRPEYDGRDAANITIAHTFSVLFGVNLLDWEYVTAQIGEDRIDQIFEDAYDQFMEILPWGDIGVHTIESIEIRPIPRAGIKMFQLPGHVKNRERLSIINRATVGIQTPVEVVFYDTTVVPYLVSTALRPIWKPTKITGPEHLRRMGKVIWGELPEEQDGL